MTQLYNENILNQRNQSIISANLWDAFGEQLKKLGEGEAKYTYGGKELDDETNLYYFNARFYDATIGRFINVDPIQDGTNWYIYCNNNPLSFVDPTGLADEEINNNSNDFPKLSKEDISKANEGIRKSILDESANDSFKFTPVEGNDVNDDVDVTKHTDALKEIMNGNSPTSTFIGAATDVISDISKIPVVSIITGIITDYASHEIKKQSAKDDLNKAKNQSEVDLTVKAYEISGNPSAVAAELIKNSRENEQLKEELKKYKK